MNLFEHVLRSGRIFANKDVLRPSYIPAYLPHRKEQIERLAEILSAALRGETPSNIPIYGKTGTGKTATVKYVAQELERMAKQIGSKTEVIYINGEIFDTQYRVFAYLARIFNRKVPMMGWPTDVVFEAFREGVDRERRCVIVVLDEVDKLVKKGDEVLYNLSRINSDLRRAKVSVVGISNDLTFTDELDARVRSSLGEEEIVFPPYNAMQLSDILKQRAELAFREGVLEEGVIPLCAAFAAQEHGDARRALDLLRVSGEIAERLGEEKVREEHVRLACERIETNKIAEVVRTLPLHSKIVLSAVVMLSKEHRKRRFTSGEIYSMYRKICGFVNIEPLTQRRVSDLTAELEMLGLVSATVVSRGRYGRTKEISLSVQESSLRDVLLSDYKLKSLSAFRLRTQMLLNEENA